MIDKKTQNSIQQSQTAGQFGGVNHTSYHKHNGVDSPRIKNSDIIGAATLLSGTVQMDGTATPTAVITDDRITTSSVIVVTSTNYIAGEAFSAVCSNGYATIYSSGAFNSSYWNYIINLYP